MDFSLVSKFGVSEDSWDAFGDAAVDLLESLLCADVFHESTEARGVTDGRDRSRLELDCWGVPERVVAGEVEVDFEVVESRDGLCSWVHLLEELPNGRRVAKVEGSFGFGGNVPPEVAMLLANLIETLVSINSGEYRVSQKSLEDVQVSLRDSLNGSEWEGFIVLARPVLALWSLCDAYRQVGGVLGFGNPLPVRPWWLGDSSLGVIGSR